MELVGDQAVLMMNDTSEVFSCNQTMTALLLELDGVRSIREVAFHLQHHFEAAPEDIASDLRLAAEELSKKGILERA